MVDMIPIAIQRAVLYTQQYAQSSTKAMVQAVEDLLFQIDAVKIVCLESVIR